MESIKLFESKSIRSVWVEAERKWYFAVSDVVLALTDSSNTTDYIKKMRSRDAELAKGWGQFVTPLVIPTHGGPQRLNCANAENLLRIIQSIPSPKAEPFKRWLAKVGAERLEEIENPELAAKRMRDLYRAKGYSEASTTEIARTQEAQGFTKNKKAARQGGTVAGNARRELEQKTGEKVVSQENYKELTEGRQKTMKRIRANKQ